MKPHIAQVSKSASTGFLTSELLHAGVICGPRRPGLLVSNDVGARARRSLWSFPALTRFFFILSDVAVSVASFARIRFLAFTLSHCRTPLRK